MVRQEEILSNVLKMKNLYFEFIHFNSTGVEPDEEGAAEIGFKEEHNIVDNIINVKLFCKVEVDNIFELELCLNGIFEAGNIESKNVVPNAIAIMFPYLRAQVSLMTAQPNIPNISLKPININALLAKQNEQ